METIDNKLPEEFKQKWIEALRSGKYKQGKGHLMMPSSDEYCCLGVACVVAGIPEDKLWHDDAEDGECLYELINELDPGIVGDIPSILKGPGNDIVIATLTQMNDGYGAYSGKAKTFSEIADHIEKNL